MKIGEKIKKLIEMNNHYDVNTIAIALEMSPQNLYKIFKKDSCETKYLEKLSKLLGVPMKYFFEENWEVNKISQEKKIVDGFEIKIESKEECEKKLAVAIVTIQQMELRIKDKEDMIALLLKERK